MRQNPVTHRYFSGYFLFQHLVTLYLIQGHFCKENKFCCHLFRGKIVLNQESSIYYVHRTASRNPTTTSSKRRVIPTPLCCFSRRRRPTLSCCSEVITNWRRVQCDQMKSGPKRSKSCPNSSHNSFFNLPKKCCFSKWPKKSPNTWGYLLKKICVAENIQNAPNLSHWLKTTETTQVLEGNILPKYLFLFVVGNDLCTLPLTSRQTAFSLIPRLYQSCSTIYLAKYWRGSIRLCL